MSLVLVCVYAYNWSHTAGSAASYILFLLFYIVIKIDSFIYRNG